TYVVRAKDESEAQQLVEDSVLLQEKGVFAIVLEKIPATLAEKVANNLNIPTIGIGAGHKVDGQVLVLHDMLGITQEFSPRFLRRYHNLYQEIGGAVKSYINDVRAVDFPNEKEQY
ncbi:MAG: 3-methyl-2-oxobutanoate hydroxymethyltransferase, partial [Bacteroidales bacterium]|nr:3-methyl-2-oxobutanoate hydroxymethyltransferase [Bacteroidales bacterium]